MSAFDDLTLGEVDDIGKTCLDGKTIAEADPLKLAGAVLWITKRKRGETDKDWDDFRYSTTMAEIKAFSIEMEAQEIANPSVAPLPAN